MDEVTHSADHAHEDTHSADHADKTVVFGYTIHQPVYTVVFGALALLTAFELAVAELLPRNWFTTGLLIVASVVKAALVVLFYMHLKDDNPLYALALIVPLLIGIVSTIFLLAVPTTGY
jgi:cytochrome c oxidase subunit 4